MRGGGAYRGTDGSGPTGTGRPQGNQGGSVFPGLKRDGPLEQGSAGGAGSPPAETPPRPEGRPQLGESCSGAEDASGGAEPGPLGAVGRRGPCCGPIWSPPEGGCTPPSPPAPPDGREPGREWDPAGRTGPFERTAGRAAPGWRIRQSAVPPPPCRAVSSRRTLKIWSSIPEHRISGRREAARKAAKRRLRKERSKKRFTAGPPPCCPDRRPRSSEGTPSRPACSAS